MSTLPAVHAHPLHLPHIKHLHLIDALVSMLHTLSEHDHFRYPPEINSLLENAAMAREMRRL